MRAASPPPPTAGAKGCCRSRAWSSAMSSRCSPPPGRCRCTSAAARGAGTRRATSSPPSFRNEAVAALPRRSRSSAGPASAPPTLGMLPGAELFRIDPSEAKTPPIVPTQFPPIEPVALAARRAAPPQYPPAAMPSMPVCAHAPMRPVMVPVYYAAPVSAPVAAPALALRAPPAPRAALLFLDASARRHGRCRASPRRRCRRCVERSPARAEHARCAAAASAARPAPAHQPGRCFAASRRASPGRARSPPAGQLGASQAGARLTLQFQPADRAVARG